LSLLAKIDVARYLCVQASSPKATNSPVTIDNWSHKLCVHWRCLRAALSIFTKLLTQLASC